MPAIERIGSFERHGEYYRVQVAVNGRPLTPVWLCAPEFEQYERSGRLFEELARVSIMMDEHAQGAMRAALAEISNSRISQGGMPR